MARKSKYSVELNDFFKELCQLDEEQICMKRLVDLKVSRIRSASTRLRQGYNPIDVGQGIDPVDITPALRTFIPFEFGVYGSTVEGLNCYTQHDMGDIDIMLYPSVEEAMLDESMLAYVDGEPAFVRVRGKDHPLLQECLYGDTDNVDTSTLKELNPTLFGFANFYCKVLLPKIIESDLKVTSSGYVSEAFENQSGASFQYDMQSESHGLYKPIPTDGFDLPEDVKRFISSCQFPFDAIQFREKAMSALNNELLQKTNENPTVEHVTEAYSDDKFAHTSISRLLSSFLSVYQQENPDLTMNPFAIYNDQGILLAIRKFYDFLSRQVSFWDAPNQDNEQEQPLKSGMDVVPSFKVKGWPQVAEDWVSRDRKWPSAETITEIVNSGFHLVHKSPKHGNTTPHLDFRLSFSHAEFLLSKELNDIQRECYRCFKLFYKALNQNREPKIISTYVLKTTLLWTVEEKSMEMWNENNRAYCVMMLLERLHDSLETKRLPHYFIPEFNLLEEAVIEYPQQLQNLADEVREMCDNPKESYQQKAMIAEMKSPNEESKDKRGSMKSPSKMGPIKKNITRKFQLMPREEFKELYYDVLREMVAKIEDGSCHVEDTKMQSIVHFLRCRLLEYDTESSKVPFPIHKIINDNLPNMEEAYTSIHQLCYGRDPRESILSVIKFHLDMQVSVEDAFDYKNNDDMFSLLKTFSDSSFLNAIPLPDFQRLIEDSFAAEIDAIPCAAAPKTTSDDDILLD